MSDMLGSVGNVVEAAIGWMGDFVTEVTVDPLLLTFVVAIPLVGLGIGLFKRLVHVRG